MQVKLYWLVAADDVIFVTYKGDSLITEVVVPPPVRNECQLQVIHAQNMGSQVIAWDEKGYIYVSTPEADTSNF